MGLTKTLSEIYYGSTTTTNKKISTNDNKISTNLHLFHQLQLCQKRHLEMRPDRQENGFDQQNFDEEENKFISNSYSLLEQARKKIRELLPEHASHSVVHFRNWN